MRKGSGAGCERVPWHLRREIEGVLEQPCRAEQIEIAARPTDELQADGTAVRSKSNRKR